MREFWYRFFSLSWFQSLATFLLFISLFTSVAVQADTDDADSLDFKSFHSKDTSIWPIKSDNEKRLATKMQRVTVSIEHDSAEGLMTAVYKLHNKMNALCRHDWIKMQERQQRLQQEKQLSFDFYCSE